MQCTWETLLLCASLLTAAGCAAIPKQAPVLSAELGNGGSALEDSYLAHLGQLFAEKRASVDRFIDEVRISSVARVFSP